MEKLYRLEFNEQQQCFYLDDGYYQPNTYGWVTISDYCSKKEFKVFDAYVNRTKKDKLTKEYLLKCLSEVRKFWRNFGECGLRIIEE